MIGNIKREYKFFSGDVIRFCYRGYNLYFKVIKDPENIFTTNYELKPWEVYENSVNLCWDWNKLTKLKTKYHDTILKYHLFRLYRN